MITTLSLVASEECCNVNGQYTCQGTFTITCDTSEYVISPTFNQFINSTFKSCEMYTCQSNDDCRKFNTDLCTFIKYNKDSDMCIVWEDHICTYMDVKKLQIATSEMLGEVSFVVTQQRKKRAATGHSCSYTTHFDSYTEITRRLDFNQVIILFRRLYHILNHGDNVVLNFESLKNFIMVDFDTMWKTKFLKDSENCEFEYLSSDNPLILDEIAAYVKDIHDISTLTVLHAGDKFNIVTFIIKLRNMINKHMNVSYGMRVCDVDIFTNAKEYYNLTKDIHCSGFIKDDVVRILFDKSQMRGDNNSAYTNQFLSYTKRNPRSRFAEYQCAFTQSACRTFCKHAFESPLCVNASISNVDSSLERMVTYLSKPSNVNGRYHIDFEKIIPINLLNQITAFFRMISYDVVNCNDKTKFNIVRIISTVISGLSHHNTTPTLSSFIDGYVKVLNGLYLNSSEKKHIIDALISTAKQTSIDTLLEKIKILGCSSQATCNILTTG